MTSTEISEQDITALIARWSEAAQLIMSGDPRLRCHRPTCGGLHTSSAQRR